MAPHERQVLIVGGGPVGVGLALELGLRGIEVSVFEQRRELSTIPKGQGLSQRTLEHMSRWGIEDELRAARIMPRDLEIGQVTIYRDLLSDHFHAKPTREVVGRFYARANERLPQYLTEQVMRTRLRAMPNVELRLGARVVDVQQDATSTSVRLDGGEQFTGDFLVGCDGGRSVVRDCSNIDRRGTDWNELVSLIVFRSRDLDTELRRRFPLRSTYRIMHPDLQGYWRFFGRVDANERFFFHAPVPAGQDAKTFDPQSALDTAAGFPVRADVEHVGFWDLRVQVATSYRSGRTFIAGDAAHTHPPYGGFGLNNGLEDAVNLGWKLAASLDGWGGEALLDSYDVERRPIFEDVGEEIIGGWIREDRQFLDSYRPNDASGAFDGAFERMARGFGARLGRFEPHYGASPVVCGERTASTSGLGEHLVKARPGHHLAPLDVAGGGSTFDLLDANFTLFDLGPEHRETVDRLQKAARSTGVPISYVPVTLAHPQDAYGCRLMLIRPDQFVAWVGDELPDDVEHLLLTAAGRTAA